MSTRTLYMVGYSESTEPWGTAPACDVDDSKLPECWHWTRDAAEKALEEYRSREDLTSWVHFTIREYQIPDVVDLDLLLRISDILRLTPIYTLMGTEHEGELGDDFKPYKWEGSELEHAEKAQKANRALLDALMKAFHDDL